MKKLLLISLLTVAACLINAQTPAACFHLNALNTPNVGSTPYTIASGDFNGDGTVDLVVPNYFSNNVSVLIGTGPGTYVAAVNYGVGSRPFGVCTSDFNGDGEADLAVTNEQGANVSILLGTGLGTFLAAVNYGVGSNPYLICSADFNGDGKADLATANYNSNNVSILMGSGTGTFAAAVNYGVGTNPTAVIPVDFNNDGNMDLALSNTGSNNVSLLLGSVTGTFAAAVNYGVGTGPYLLSSADFNSDGRADLASANYSSGNVSILLGSAAGTLATAVNYAVNPNPTSVNAADFNGDGKVDLAVVFFSSSSVGVLLGSGTGTFVSSGNFTVGANPWGSCTADLDGDGKPDLATANLTSNNVSILLNGVPSLTVTSSNTVCTGSSFTITASGANTYSWNTGSNSSSITVTPTINTTYTVTGSSTGACTNTAERTITVIALPVITITPSSTVICVGKTTTLTAGGGSTYLWNTGPTTSTLSASPGANTSYTVTGTDAATGCSNTAVQSVSVNVLPTVTITPSSTVICVGNVATLTAGGASTYLWNTGPTTTTLSVSPGANTSYTVTGTAAATGCSNTAVQSVSVNILPTVTITPSSTVICVGKTTTLTAGGASTYLWNTGPATSTLSVSPGANTSYTVTGTAAATGCSNTAVQSVSVNILPTVTITPSSTVICVGKIATLTAGGASTYLWDTGPTTSTLSVSPGANTSYTVTGTAAATGCSNTAVQAVSVNILPTVTITPSSTVICVGNTATLTAGGASTYLWNTGPTTTTLSVSPGANTSYTVTGTAAATGCSNTAVQAVSVNILPTVTITPSSTVICVGKITTLTAGGASTYLWNTGPVTNTLSVSPGATTSYTVTGTSAATGCSNTAVQSVSVNILPTVTITPSSTVICVGKTATLTAGGASTYLWDTGPTTTTLSVSPGASTSYTVTGTAAATGCSNTAVQSVSVNILPSVTITPSSTVMCLGNSVTLTAGGATTFLWNTGPSSNTISVSPGSTTSYTVTGTAAATGCSNTAMQSVSVNILPTVTITPSSTVICVGKTATLTSGGASTYLWNTGPSTTTLAVSPGSTTSYTVTGTAAATGCSNTAVQSVSVNILPTVTITPSSTVICVGKTATLTGGGANTYTWNTGPATSTLSVSPGVNTSYTVTGTAATTGCSNTAIQSISVNVLPTPSITPTSTVICFGKFTTLFATGANTYTWNTGSISSAIAVSPTITSIYTVTGTSALTGCSNTAVQSVSVNALPPLIISTTGSIICFGKSSTLTASGATSYLWNTSSTSASISVGPATTTNYTVNGTSAVTGCSVNAVQTISVNALPILTVTANGTVICAGKTSTLVATGATFYNWSNGSNLDSNIVSPPSNTNYTVVGISATTGCSNTAMVSLSVNALPVMTITPSSTVICFGKTSTLTTGGANTYTWNTGATSTLIVVSPSVSANFTVTGTSAITGCSNTAIQSVSVNALPSLSIVPSSSVLCYGNSATLTAGGANSFLWNTSAVTASIIVSPTTTTNYTVNGTSAVTGCSVNAVQTVSVNALPPVAIFPMSPVICIGKTDTLYAGGADSYLWNTSATSSSIIVSPTVNTSYTVVGTSALTGCSNTAVQSVSVNTLPTLTITPSTTVICVGKSASLTAAGALTYTWSTNATATTIAVSPTVNASYTLTGTAAATGCSNTAVQSISVNVLPTMTITTTSTVLCAGKSATLTVSGTDSYLWSIIGSTNTLVIVTPVFNQNYTVTGTDALTTCSNIAVRSISVNALPVVTASAVNSIVCTGVAANLSAGGANTYTWMPGNLIGSPITPSPSITTTYTVTGSSAASGCTNQAVKTISVNITPTVTLVSNTPSLCVGSSATLTPSGAATYTLFPGNISGSTFTVAPLSTTIYSVTATNSVNCINLTPAAVTITVNALTSITGAVTSTVGQVNGNVVLYRYKPFLSKWDSVTSSLIFSSLYNFPSVLSGTYVVKAFPFQTDMLETYGSSSPGWKGASIINHHCVSTSTQNINVIQIQNTIKGQGSFSGKITQGPGYTQPGTPGAPIPNIIVQGGILPTGIIAQRSRTNAMGQYTLANLTANNPGEHYYVTVDIPGLDTTKAYHRVLLTGFENFVNLDFVVDSERITPTNLTVGIKNIEMVNAKLSVFPNPANSYVTVVFDLLSTEEISMELSDLSGRIVKTLLPATKQTSGDLTVVANVSDIPAGVYFLNVKVADQVKTTKMVITR